MDVLDQIIGQLGRSRVKRLPRAARPFGQSEVPGYTSKSSQMLAMIIMIVTHLRNWDGETARGLSSHCRKQNKFFFFHVHFELTQHLLKRIGEAMRNLRMIGMDRLYLSAQLD
jgi:hypothetical protein